MVLLIAFNYVLPPITLGRYPTIQQCKLNRSAWVELVTRHPHMNDVTLICRDLDMVEKAH